MQIFTIVLPDDLDKRQDLKSLLNALGNAFDMTVQDAIIVETENTLIAPILSMLEEQSQGKVEEPKPKVVITYGEKINTCPQCGTLFAKGIGSYCSKKCYNLNYRARNKEAKKQSNGALPNQVQVDAVRLDEQERIDAVVAKAKQDTTSAFNEHRIKGGGAIMARKL